MIGVEHELFVYAPTGRPVTLDESARLLDAIGTPACGAVVKYEHAPHLLEVATTPCASLAALRRELVEVWKELDAAAARAKLVLAHEPLARVPSTDPSVQPTLKRNRELVAHRRRAGVPIDDENFSAVLAATQIHVEFDLEQLDSVMPGLYEALASSIDDEYRAIEDPRSIARRRWSSYARGCPGQLVGFPDLDAWTVAAWRSASRCSRDNQAIKPRPELGTLEFRSAPAQPTVDAIVALAELRLAQCAAPRGASRPFRTSRTAWWSAMIGDGDPAT